MESMKAGEERRRAWLARVVGGIAVLLLASFTSESAAGTISGTVRAVGPRIEEPGGERGAYPSRRHRFAERIDYDTVRDFVVYIERPAPEAPPPAEEDLRAVVVQRDAMFQPQVLPVMVGTTVEWPNRDDIYHNVFSISEAREFDLGYYKDDEESDPKTVVFDKPGRVDVFCAIHTQMHCVVLVLENPFFAATDRRGRYELTGVPPGTYQVRAWHPRLPSRAQEVTVPEDGEVRVDFTLGFGELPED